MTKSKFDTLPAFRKGPTRKKAAAAHKALAEAANAEAEVAAKVKQAELDAKNAAEAAKRKKVGDYIARQGNGALLSAAPSFLRGPQGAYSVITGLLADESAGFKEKYCVVFPAVRALQGRLRTLSVAQIYYDTWGFHGVFVWACRTPNSPTRRCPARAGALPVDPAERALLLRLQGRGRQGPAEGRTPPGGRGGHAVILQGNFRSLSGFFI
jgi:hypothetical protein